MSSEAPISVRNVTFAFGSGSLVRKVLDDVTVEVARGEVVLLTGPSGSGKTTLLTLIGALRGAQQGSLRVLGHELGGAPEEVRVEVRRRIGYVFQSHNLLSSVSARENVELTLEPRSEWTTDERRRRAVEMLAAVGLGELTERRPHELSGGQRQRVAIARALAGEPRLVLADEPTASLDKASGREVVELLSRLAREQGVTVVVVTHDSRILDVADRVLHLEDGRLSSLTAAVAATTENQMAGLVRTFRHGELQERVEKMAIEEFKDLLDELTREARRLTDVLLLAESEGFESMLDQVLAVATRKAGQLLGAERATIFLVDRQRQILWSKYAQGAGAGSIEIQVPFGSGIAGAAFATGKMINVVDAHADPRFDPSADRASGFVTRSLLCAPLKTRDGEVIAVAEVLNRLDGAPFDADDERRFTNLFSPLVAILQAWAEMSERRQPQAEA